MNHDGADPREVAGGCPSREVLTELATGNLPLSVMDTLGEHIETCSACQALLETLDTLEDSVIALIKGQTGPLLPDPELQAQIREAEQISRVVWGEPNDDRPEESPPQRMGQYVLLEKIGRGGMGRVYKAVHTRLKRLVAIKLLSEQRLADSQAVGRFQREMEAVGRLDHPHLVRAHDAGEAEGQHYLVMEFLDGIDLAHLVRQNGPLPVAEACEAIRQAALGLQHAHEHDLVHRDIKPSNLMLSSEGTVRVLDLGLARLTEEHTQADEATATGQIVGTGDFIAPEQGQDTRQADARSDIYSLGCTLYFLLAGKAPFSGPEYNTFVRKVMAHSREPIIPLQTIRRDIPDALQAALDRMLAKEPAGRFQTAAEVAEVLAAFVHGSDLRGVLAGRAGNPDVIPLCISAGRRVSRRPLLLLLVPILGLGLWCANTTIVWTDGSIRETAPSRQEELTRWAEAESKKIWADMEPDIRKTNAELTEDQRAMHEDVEEVVKEIEASLPHPKPSKPSNETATKSEERTTGPRRRN